MHISFTVPLSALIGAAGVLYPAIMVAVARFISRRSAGRFHPLIVGVLAAVWPATLGVTLAAMPVWLAYWFVSNYFGTVGDLLRGRNQGQPNQVQGQAQVQARPQVVDGFVVGSRVEIARRVNDDVPAGWKGRILDRRDNEYKVDFDSFGGGGVHWVKETYLRQA
jgi:hypothetical protein